MELFNGIMDKYSKDILRKIWFGEMGLFTEEMDQGQKDVGGRTSWLDFIDYFLFISKNMRSCQNFFSYPETFNFSTVLSPSCLYRFSCKSVILFLSRLLSFLEFLTFFKQTCQCIFNTKSQVKVRNNRKTLHFDIALIRL